MNELHPACWAEEELLTQCRLTFSRASGPGGQNRNKVETSVQIEFLPSGVIASASERRTQNENRKVAVMRLRCKLAVDVRLAAHLDSSNPLIGSDTWRLYCRDGRVDISDTNQDWPSILAELIGALSRFDWNASEVARTLDTSSSQIVKLLKKYGPAFVRFNEERKSRGQRPFA
ncbi:MAG: peptide chain release factor-like protein [Planctomycetota bacterium]|nr:peptide chain release factor-like protein [Planctomycetota bacterium]